MGKNNNQQALNRFIEHLFETIEYDFEKNPTHTVFEIEFSECNLQFNFNPKEFMEVIGSKFEYLVSITMNQRGNWVFSGSKNVNKHLVLDKSMLVLSQNKKQITDHRPKGEKF